MDKLLSAGLTAEQLVARIAVKRLHSQQTEIRHAILMYTLDHRTLPPYPGCKDTLLFPCTDPIHPKTLGDLIPKYLSHIPTLTLPGTPHAPSSEVVVFTKKVKNRIELIENLTDTGKWLYVPGKWLSIRREPMRGELIIDCKHMDYTGVFPYYQH